MAWVTQRFETGGYSFALEREMVFISGEDAILMFKPSSMESAHDLALCFRRIARRLEEIGKGLD